MPAPATAAEFLELVRKAGVADEARLAAHLERLEAGPGLPTAPADLAKILVRDGVLTGFQADQVLQGRWKRFGIGRYRVLDRLGVGGMGQVFLCEHKLMRRRVAVKVLPAAKAKDRACLERFHREARAVAALDHPHIVRAYDVDQDDGLHFLVMEYVAGPDLQELVRTAGPLAPDRAARYAHGAAVGLQHAHQMGLIHRDVKPGNLMVGPGDVVKVLDLGLARFFHDEDDQLTRKYDELVLGTADYLAPEQAVDSHAVDGRADVYGLGATLYFVLTGRPPFPDGTVAQKLLAHQTEDPAPLRKVRPDVPAGLAAVVARMMAKDPAARYQTPAEVADALAPWVPDPVLTGSGWGSARGLAAGAAGGATATATAVAPVPAPAGSVIELTHQETAAFRAEQTAQTAVVPAARVAAARPGRARLLLVAGAVAGAAGLAAVVLAR